MKEKTIWIKRYPRLFVCLFVCFSLAMIWLDFFGLMIIRSLPRCLLLLGECWVRVRSPCLVVI